MADPVLFATDPISGLTLEVGTPLYADDLRETNLTENAEVM